MFSIWPESGITEKLTKYGLGLDIEHSNLTKERIDELHAAGIVINCFTCDTAERAKELISWNVDMITSNIVL